jgi:hypothetical protein
MKYDKNHQLYRPADSTNVLDTLRAAGFVPPSEQQRYIDKWKYFKSLGARREVILIHMSEVKA